MARFAFSFIEVVLAMTILSVLVGVSVTTYRDSVQQSKHDTALQKLQHLSNAVQRWEMEYNQRYPYSTLTPLVGKYINRLESDPWGGEYAVDPDRGFVFSPGPNKTNNLGEGDDIVVSFDTDRDPPPGAPTQLKAEQSGANITLTWNRPKTDSDGSPLGEKGDDPVLGDLHATDAYHLYVRRSRDPSFVMTDVPAGGIANSAQSCSFTTSDIGIVDETVFFTLKAVDESGSEGPPSNVAGIYLVAETKPVINVFQAVPSWSPINSPWMVNIDVSDGDANLTSVRLEKLPGGLVKEWKTTDSSLENTFHPVLIYTDTPTTPEGPFDLKLTVSDGTSIVSTTISDIRFTNSPPVINSLSPGIYTLTVDPGAGPGDEVSVTYIVEAADAESNMRAMILSATYTYDNAGTPTSQHIEKQWAYPAPGVRIAVESHDLQFIPNTVQDVPIVAMAYDDQDMGNWNQMTKKVGKLSFSEDKTEPKHLSLYLDRSNDVLRYESFPRWWITTEDQIIGNCWSWENESPPVTYWLCISTSPRSSASFETNAITQGGGGGPLGLPACWLDFQGLDNGNCEWTIDAAHLSSNFDRDHTYYMSCLGINSVGLSTPLSVPPRHWVTKVSQDGFGFDDLPPVFLDINIDSLGTVSGTTDAWIQRGPFNADWACVDYRHEGGSPPGYGSGPAKYRYMIQYRGAASDVWSLDTDWVTVDSPEISDHLFSIPEGTYTAWGLAGRTPQFLLSLQVRDTAGNWSPVSTAGARMDLTTPTPIGIPIIWDSERDMDVQDTTDKTLHTADVIEVRFPNVFVDPESEIESYDWGVATTTDLGLLMSTPNLGGGWKNVDATQTIVTYHENNFLEDKQFCYAMLRARNFAQAVSGVVFSTGAYVDASLNTGLQASPRAGFSPLTVQFKAWVSPGSGTPPFRYRFLFDGTLVNGRIYEKDNVADWTPVTTSYSYTLGDFGPGRLSAVVEIVDAIGAKTYRDVYFDLYPPPYIGAILDISANTDPRFVMYRFDGGVLTHLFNGRMALDTNSNQVIALDVVASQYAQQDYIAFIGDDPGGNQDVVVTWDMKGPHDISSFCRVIGGFAQENPTTVKMAGDGSFIVCAGNGKPASGPMQGWVRKILLDPSTGILNAWAESSTVFTAIHTTNARAYPALALWSGGASGAAALNGPSGGRNWFRIQGMMWEQYNFNLEGSQYLGNDDSLVYGKIIGMAVSPDNRHIVATTHTNPSRAIIGNTSNLMSGGVSHMTTNVDRPTAGQNLGNPVWRFDSQYFYVSQQSAGNLWACKINVPTPSFASVGITGTAPTNANYIDISSDSRYMAVADGSHLWVGEFNEDAVTHVPIFNDLVNKASVVVPGGVHIRQCRFICPPRFGAPIVRQTPSIDDYVHPNGSIDLHLSGANLVPGLTQVTAVSVTGGGTITESFPKALASCTYDYADCNVSAAGVMAGDHVTLYITNSIGSKNLTTNVTFSLNTNQ